MSRAVDSALTGEVWEPEDEHSPNGHQRFRVGDLGDLVGRPAKRPPIQGNAVYPRKAHSVGGEPGQGKSTVVCWWMHLAISHGFPVVLVDYEAGDDHVSDLFHSFGTEPAAVSKYLKYIESPSVAWSPADVSEFIAMLKGINPVLVGFDSSISVLSAMGGNENSPTDIRRMWDRVFIPIAHGAGYSVVVTDHSGKDAGESRYNRGSTDKLAVVDVNMKLVAETPFSRHQDGVLDVTVTKDRPGWLHWHWQVIVTRNPLALRWVKTRAKSRPAGSGPAAESLLAVLGDSPAGIRDLVDRIVGRGGIPLKRDTAYRALMGLHEQGLAEKVDQGPGAEVLWMRPQPAPVPGSDQPSLV
jgi:AAA domain